MPTLQPHLGTVTLELNRPRPTPYFDREMRNKAEVYKIENHPVQMVDGSQLELVDFVEKGDIYGYNETGYIERWDLQIRARELGGITAYPHLVQLLAQAETIPVEWRKFRLVFPLSVGVELERAYVRVFLGLHYVKDIIGEGKFARDNSRWQVWANHADHCAGDPFLVVRVLE